MTPADSFVWAVAVASAAWLFVSTVVPVALRGAVAVGQAFRPLSRPIASVVAAVLLISVIRSAPGAATVPPPAERVIVDGWQPSGVVAVRTPVSETRSTGAGSATYTVVAGDTLWGIARGILERTGQLPEGADITSAWKLIYDTNTDVVGPDPNLILPGQVLTIPGGVHG